MSTFLVFFKLFILCGSIRSMDEAQENHLNSFVDLSHHNKDVDLAKAKKDGITAVILKATEGVDWVDPKYAERKIAAEKENIFWGAYHFGTGSGSGFDQARHFLQTTAFTINDTRRAILDLEDNPRGKTMSLKQAENFVLSIFDKTMGFPLIYGTASFLERYNTSHILTSCPLWIASYNEKEEPTMPRGWKQWYLWQYTDGKLGAEPKKVRGIGHCDRSKLNKIIRQYRK